MGHEHHDYHADMNFGMATFFYAQREAGSEAWDMASRIKGLWSIGYVSSLYKLGIANGTLA